MNIERFETIIAAEGRLSLESKYKTMKDLGERMVCYKAGEGYFVFDNRAEFVKIVENSAKNNTFCEYHEVIFDVPQKLKFDIDASFDKFGEVSNYLNNEVTGEVTGEVNNSISELFGEIFVDSPAPQPCEVDDPYTSVYNDIFTTIIKAIRDAFIISYGKDLNRENEIITSSHGPNKFSNHIIIDKYYVENAQQAQEFTKLVASFLPNWYKKFLDLGVNKRLQNFRAPLCQKKDSNRVKKIITNHSTILALISNIDNCELLPTIGKPTEQRREINSDDSSKILGLCIGEAFSAHVYRGQSRGEFIFDRLKPSLCDFCLRTHLNDNTVVVVTAQIGNVLSVRRQCRKYIEEHGYDGNHFCVLGEIETDATNTITTICDNICNRTIDNINAGKIASNKLLFDCADNNNVIRNIYYENTLRPFELSRTLVVRAMMKMGKTKTLKNYIHDHFKIGLTNPVIRFISFRQTFSSNIKETFTDFTLYSDVKGPLIADRLIVQVESLHRVVIGSEPPDLLVLDECESIFEQFESGLIRDFNESFAVFQYLVKYSKHLICMDAGLSDRTYRILAQMRPGVIHYHYNQWKNATEDTYYVGGNKLKWLAELYEKLDANKKIAIPTNSLDEAKTLLGVLTKKYPDRSIKMYSSETIESEKKIHFADVNQYWLVDVLIYTPTVSAGVSFEQKHFDMMFGYFTDQSCTVETCQQMMGRVRDIGSKTYYICFIATGNNLPIDIQAIEKSLHNKRDRLAQNVCSSGLRFEFGPTGEIIHHGGDYFRIWVENTRIRNLSKNSFVRRFLTQLHHTGARVISHPDLQYDEERIKADHAETRDEIKLLFANEVANSPDLDPEEVNDIATAMMAQADIDHSTKMAYEKHRLRADYRYDGVIDAKFVMKYHRREVRRTYKNICRLRSEPTMEDAWKKIQAEELAMHKYLMSTETTQHSDLRRRYVFEQHRYAGGLLKMLGWSHIDDPVYLHRTTIENNINSSDYQKIIIEANNEFGIKNIYTSDVDRVIKNINKIIGIMYGIAINAQKNTDMYYLKHNTMFTDDPKISTTKMRPLIVVDNFDDL